MGSVWLHDLPAYLIKRGVYLDFYPGWELRSNASGGLIDIRGIGTHHDAGAATQTEQSRMDYCWKNSKIKPEGNLFLHKSGRVVMGAAGSTNTQGLSEQDFIVSRGVIPKDKGNFYMISIEAANNGVGEEWPKVQVDAYILLCAAICEWAKLNPITDIFSHHRYTKRKIDPAGPTPGYGIGPGSWKDSVFNQEVFNKIQQPVKEEKEVEMLSLDYGEVNTPTWVATTWTGVELAWQSDGHAAAVANRAGVRREPISREEFIGIIKSSKTTTAAPVGQGMDAELTALWNAQR
jgi:hypothetical protein